jgi:hypothetical protein
MACAIQSSARPALGVQASGRKRASALGLFSSGAGILSASHRGSFNYKNGTRSIAHGAPSFGARADPRSVVRSPLWTKTSLLLPDSKVAASSSSSSSGNMDWDAEVNGDPPRPPPGNNEDGGDGDGNGDAYAALLLAAGRRLETLPLDVATAVQKGKIAPDMFKKYLDMGKNPILFWLMQFPGFRERLMADPGFILKLAIELGIGICTKTTAEYAKRQDKFESQLDFVAANILMALVADFMLVWLPAPTYAVGGKVGAASGGLLKKFNDVFKGCPENAFQVVPPGYAPFTLGQRAGAVVRNGIKLFGVGCGASLLGVAITNGLIELRQFMDPSFVPLNDPQDVATMSAAYGLYMASSSNLRYQVLAGVLEERVIEKIFRGNPAICGALSFAVRTGNTFLGSLMWVDFIRLLGLQK